MTTGTREVAAGFSRDCRVGPRGGGLEEMRKFRGHLGKSAGPREQPVQRSAGATMPGSWSIGKEDCVGGWRMEGHKNVNLAVRREAQEGLERGMEPVFIGSLWLL